LDFHEGNSGNPKKSNEIHISLEIEVDFDEHKFCFTGSSSGRFLEGEGFPPRTQTTVRSTRRSTTVRIPPIPRWICGAETMLFLLGEGDVLG